MTENTHLEMMAGDKPGVETWRSLSKIAVPLYSFDAGARMLFLKFVLASPESGIRAGDVRFSADGRRCIADFIVEGHNYDEALDLTALAALGGLVCAGLSVTQVDVIDVHMARARDMGASHDSLLDKPKYEVSELDTFMAFASAAELLSEAA